MTLPTIPTSISFSQINVELGLSATATISLNDTAVRNLAAVLTGAISISNLSGKTYGGGGEGGGGGGGGGGGELV